MADMSSPPFSAATEHRRLHAQAERLEWATIGWNILEVGVTIGLGIAAGSLALVAFGLEAIVEVFASVVVVWHLRGGERHRDPARKARSLGLVGGAFVALAALLAIGAIAALVQTHRPDRSPWGIAWLAAAAVVMITLGLLKRSLARRMTDEALASEAIVTLLDGLLAGLIMVSLVLNAVFEWWWADPLATLGVAIVAALEGTRTMRLAGRLVSDPTGRG